MRMSVGIMIDETALWHLWCLESMLRDGQFRVAFFSCECWLVREDNLLDLLLLVKFIRGKIFLHTHLVKRSLFN